MCTLVCFISRIQVLHVTWFFTIWERMLKIHLSACQKWFSLPFKVCFPSYHQLFSQRYLRSHLITAVKTIPEEAGQMDQLQVQMHLQARCQDFTGIFPLSSEHHFQILLCLRYRLSGQTLHLLSSTSPVSSDVLRTHWVTTGTPLGHTGSPCWDVQSFQLPALGICLWN